MESSLNASTCHSTNYTHLNDQIWHNSNLLGRCDLSNSCPLQIVEYTFARSFRRYVCRADVNIGFIKAVEAAASPP